MEALPADRGRDKSRYIYIYKNMGRNGYGPKWLWAEMVMGRNDPEPFRGTLIFDLLKNDHLQVRFILCLIFHNNI